MPNNNGKNNKNDNSQQNNTNKNNNNNAPTSKQIVLGCDTNTGSDANAINTVEEGLKQAGYDVHKLDIGPSPFSDYGYHGEPQGKVGIYLMAASLISYADGFHDLYDYDIFIIRGDASSLVTSQEAFETAIIPRDSDCNSVCEEFANMTYPQMNEKAKGKCVAVYGGKTAEEMLQAAISALNGAAITGGGGSMVNSGGGAQVKDKTFEQCIRRICAATDSVFIVDNNVATLFPYTDWLAITLRQKIISITKEEIDPNIFTTEYNDDGFYNKVSIAWGGATLPERFPEKQTNQSSSNYTMNDILKNMNETNFTIKKPTNNTVKTKKGKTTQTLSIDETGTSILSEQYDSLVEKYGVLEKRVQSKAPDLETAQYIANALLIQYIRDFNNACRCRAITNRKYQGGTFYAVNNPFTGDVELQFLNGYSMRLQKKHPLYHDLDFRYGPEGAEEISDYQNITGGGGSGGAASVNADGSATEQQIWEDAAKIHYSNGDTCSSDDPKEAYDTLQPKLGQPDCKADCFGMSSYLYYRFNYQAGIPCRIIVGSGNGASGTHRVVMLYKNNDWYRPVDEYRKLEGNFRYNSSCKTTNNIHKKEPNGGTSDQTNTVGGNTGG